MKITIGISGGIASYKTASLVSALSKENDVHVIMTKNATEFITPLTFEALTKNKVMVNEFDNPSFEYIEHIEFGQNTDILVVVPATANVIGKMANGICDDLLTSTIIASTCPKLICPAMNDKMYLSPQVQDNLSKLKSYGYIILDPASGSLACGTTGVGKLPDTKTIIDKIYEVLGGES